MRRQRFDGRLEFLFADGSLHRSHAGDPGAARHRGRPRPRARQSEPDGVQRISTWPWATHAGRLGGPDGTRTPPTPDDYVALGVQRLQSGGTRWVSGPQLPRGDGPVSRAVALALASFMGRGGSRKWAVASRARGARIRTRLGERSAAMWARAAHCSSMGAGTSAGRSTRTPSWRLAFWSAVSG